MVEKVVAGPGEAGSPGPNCSRAVPGGCTAISSTNRVAAMENTPSLKASIREELNDRGIRCILPVLVLARARLIIATSTEKSVLGYEHVTLIALAICSSVRHG